MTRRTIPLRKSQLAALNEWITRGCPGNGPLWSAASWEHSAFEHAHGGDVTSDLLRAMQVVTAALGLPSPRRYDAQVHATNVAELVRRLDAAEAA